MEVVRAVWSLGNEPVWLHLLQELHLILDAGASLKLFNYHLGGAETGADLAQQDLVDTDGSVNSNKL